MKVEIPEKLGFLFEPQRYKVLYGGRGGAKSWGIARTLIILTLQKPLRILCAREFQKSISESVHKLLSDQIKAMGLASEFEILQTSIRCNNGSEFSFVGIRHNIENVKSFEGVDIVWVEEANTVSKTSWDVLIPTIRKDKSEIWISFNPELESDETYDRFVINPPRSAKVVKVNYSDNPWFPDVLQQEMEDLKAKDYDAYLNVWEGHCRQHLEGAIYANELRAATEQGRICTVPYDRSKPVHTFWDLGWSDHTSIWFAQSVGFEYRIIDFVQDRQKTITYFLQLLQGKGYLYGTDWLPHDAENKTLASGGRSIEELMRAAGRKVRIIPRLSVEHGINAARTIFPNCWFDTTKCADGLQSLRHYRYDVDPDTKQFSKVPMHDEYSHGADAFRYLALSLNEKPDKPKLKPPIRVFDASTQQLGWMGS